MAIKEVRPGDDAGMAMLAGFAAATMEQMRGTRFTVIILYPGEEDASVGIQLGIAILLDMPILVIRGEGVAVPNKLRQVADEIADVQMLDRTKWEESRPQVEVAIKRMLARLDKAARWDSATKKQNWRQQ